MKKTIKLEKGNFLYPEDLFDYMTLGHRAGLLRTLKEYRAEYYDHDIYIELAIVETAFKATLYTGTYLSGRKMNRRAFILLSEGYRFELKLGVNRKYK